MRLVIRELRQTYWRADFHLAVGLVSNCIMTNAETLYYPISCGEKMWPCKSYFDLVCGMRVHHTLLVNDEPSPGSVRGGESTSFCTMMFI